MKKLFAIFLILTAFGITQSANASKIPDAELNIIQQEQEIKTSSQIPQ